MAQILAHAGMIRIVSHQHAWASIEGHRVPVPVFLVRLAALVPTDAESVDILPGRFSGYERAFIGSQADDIAVLMVELLDPGH